MVKDAGTGDTEAGPDAAPATIGPYVVLRELGSGGMGVVSLCRAGSGRLVAVKQVPEEYADDPAFRSRFRREIAAARRVSGVYTVPVVDADTDGPRPWVATVYVPGPTLDQAVRACGSFQEPALRALGTGLVEALQAVHAAGLVHRDLQPGNVLLAPDGPRVIDFGITKAVDETRLTRTGTVVGSPAFMAPEQIVSSREVGPECDVFAFAGVLVYAACGEGPFGPGDEGVLHRVVTDEPNLHGVPSALHPLLLRCLDKSPARRPALEQVLAELAPSDPEALLTDALREQLAARARDAELMLAIPPPPGAPPGTGPLVGRRRLLIGGLSALGVAVAGGAGAVAWATLGGDDKKQAGAPPNASASPVLTLTDPPAPLWTAAVPISAPMPQLYALGSTLVVHDSSFSAAAFDATTGALRWKYGSGADHRPVNENTALAVGAHILGSNGTVLVASDLGRDLSSSLQGYVQTLDPATTRPVTRAALGRFVHPVMFMANHENTAYCALTDLTAATGSPSATASPSITGTSFAAAIDLTSGAVRWRQPVLPTSLYNIRYAADASGFYYTQGTKAGVTVRALKATDGTSRWSVDMPTNPGSILPPYMQGASGSITSALAAGAGLLIAMHATEGMIAYDAQSGQRRWAVPMRGGTPPALVGDLALTNDGSRVYAVDLRSGRLKWSVQSPVPLSVYQRTVAASDQVTAVLFGTIGTGGNTMSLIGGTTGCLALRTSDGKQLWALREKPDATTAPSPSPSPSASDAPEPPPEFTFNLWALAVQGSTVYIGDGGRVRAYRADAG